MASKGKNYTIWLEEEAKPPMVSELYIMGFFCITPICCCKFPAPPAVAIATPASPGVWVDGVEGGDGPAWFPVPVLLAGPDEVGFLFLLVCYK